MPKHMGKTIKRFHYLPLLDDANINDQGLDANGASSDFESTITVYPPDASGDSFGSPTYDPAGIINGNLLFVGNDATVDATAITAAKTALIAWAEKNTNAGGLGLTTAAGTIAQKYTELTTTGGASAYDLGYRFTLHTSVPGYGNLYGSSKDVGYISGKMPTLSESGGTVNRVGMTRIEVEGTITKYGFHEKYTKESIDFDTDAELEMHINSTMVKGANEITEDLLQIDLLSAAGVVRFGGSAVKTSELTGETGVESVITYNDLMRLEIDLDNNRCPKNTKLISGSRMVDTRVVNGARYMYVGSEMIPTLKNMKDNFNNQAFIAVAKYASATNIARGEIGSIGGFRIITVPEMMHWAGAGAVATASNAGYRETGGKYDVFPLLVVGSGSFTTIGLQTDGRTVKFKIKHVRPESEISYALEQFGETGFMSIKWYYGFMALRPERIALIKTVAEF